jgi:hypothetical protein
MSWILLKAMMRQYFSRLKKTQCGRTRYLIIM